MTLYGLKGNRSGYLLSYGGRILVHHNENELQFLFPGTQVVRVSDGIPAEITLPIPQHPELAGISWPLNRRDFRR